MLKPICGALNDHTSITIYTPRPPPRAFGFYRGALRLGYHHSIPELLSLPAGTYQFSWTDSFGTRRRNILVEVKHHDR